MIIYARLYILFFLLIRVLCLDAFSEHTISIQDMNYRMIDQAKAQTPFILQLELDHKHFIDYDIKHIPGLHNFKHSPVIKHSIVSSCNGQPCYKTIYKFILKSEKKGTFIVGPFILKDKKDQCIKISRYSISVGDEIILSDQVEAEKYMTVSWFEKNSLFVGEKGTLHVQLFDRVFVDTPSVVFPDFQYFKILDVAQADTTSIQNINGYDYLVTQWAIDFYPTCDGILTMQDMKIKFFEQRSQETSLSRGVFRRFGDMITVARELDLQPLQIDVYPLPESNNFYDVKAVGQFTDLRLSVNKNFVMQGQGLVLTTELFGMGNFEMLDFKKLILPQEFQYYDAGDMKINDQRTCKRSEFIVQANEPGNFEIAPQEFDYFDPIDQQYKKLYSNAITIAVDADIELQKYRESQIISLQDELSNPHRVQSIFDYKILSNDKVFKYGLAMVSLWWYQLLLYILLCIWICMMIYRYFLIEYVFVHDSWNRFFIFLCARIACQRAQSKNKPCMLHAIFFYLFVSLRVATAGAMHSQDIEKYLKDHDFSDNQIVQWRNFYSKLLRVSFTAHDELDSSVLFQESFIWLQQLKEKV